MPRQIRHRTEYSGVYFVELANQVQSFFIRYKRNGKSIEEKAGRSNQGWNAEKADQMRTERKSGIYTADGEMQSKVLYKDQQHWTFSKIFAEYLRIRRELKGRENDVYRFKNYLEMEFADKTPEDVTLGDVERIRQNLQNKRLKPATVRHALELLRRLANFAAKKKLCPGLSFKIEMPRVENHKTESLTQDQLQKLLDVLDEEQDVQVSNLVRLALFTGMRRGELFSLSWSDIDFHNKTITIRSGNNGQHSTIPLNELAENVLIEQAQAEAGSKFVFPGRGGKKRTECKRPLLRIKLKAGLPDDFRILQGLRHVYASMLASSGNVELETLQALLTQKSSLMTQRYAHLLDEAQKNSSSMAGEKANSVLDSAEKEETLCGRVNDDSPENAQQPAFPEENVSEPEDTLEEEKVEDYAAEYAGTVIRLKEQPLGEEQEEDFAEDYAGTEIEPEAGFLEEEQEEDYAVEYTDTEIAPEEEETTDVEDDLSTHIAQVVEEEVCLQNENELTESAEKAQK
ncbi:MAG: site-specific integrase, partial [SAR324 cluster bacterium]|nr:site-specific integrase [SAR324 cluster bacterium]